MREENELDDAIKKVRDSIYELGDFNDFQEYSLEYLNKIERRITKEYGYLEDFKESLCAHIDVREGLSSDE